MAEPLPAQALAGFLRELKSNTGRSYEALAQRLGVSRSALHRYCSGAGAPPPYSLVERFAQECGANRTQLAELRRRWARAEAAWSARDGDDDRRLRPPLPAGEAQAEPASAPRALLRSTWLRWTAPVVLISVTALLLWRPGDNSGPDAAATAGSQSEDRANATGPAFCEVRRGVKHADSRQGRVWTTDFVCPNRTDVPLYATPDSAAKIAVMDTPKSWFVCWKAGRAQSNGDTVWYYTRGDRSEPGAHAWQGWGFMASEQVYATVHPWPGMPRCAFGDAPANRPTVRGVPVPSRGT
jgi:transcriptional regulator with XRE-family HTH domain